MFDHVTLNVADFAKSKSFYEKALASFGYSVVTGEDGIYLGFGAGRPQFWISRGDAEHQVSHDVHVAFTASGRATVDAFYEAALAAGGADNGAPGLRPEYDAAYYGAFVRDPDGNNIEAVTFGV